MAKFLVNYINSRVTDIPDETPMDDMDATGYIYTLKDKWVTIEGHNHTFGENLYQFMPQNRLEWVKWMMGIDKFNYDNVSQLQHLANIPVQRINTIEEWDNNIERLHSLITSRLEYAARISDGVAKRGVKHRREKKPGHVVGNDDSEPKPKKSRAPRAVDTMKWKDEYTTKDYDLYQFKRGVDHEFFDRLTLQTFLATTELNGTPTPTPEPYIELKEYVEMTTAESNPMLKQMCEDFFDKIYTVSL